MEGKTYNDIIFTNVNKWYSDSNGEYSYTGILVASKLNQKNGQNYKLIDAIDIDWNGAWISTLNSYINDTEDLVNVLNILNKNDDVNILDNKITEIWKQIHEITATYITYTSLYDILSTSYQKKLVPGEFITIDENNVITTYDLASYTYLADNYTSLFKHGLLESDLHENYYDKIKTEEKIRELVKAGIDSVIDGADNAFDTLKEIADWILEQNRYVEVSVEDVLNAFNDPENEDQFFYLDEETGKYIEVTSAEEVNELLAANPDIKFFRLENYLTDIKKLIEEVDELQETVGDKIYNEEYDTYTYTGILKDINQLYFKDSLLQSQIDDVSILTSIALETANTAYKQSEIAYTTANIAYDTANIAYDLSAETRLIADEAYIVAKKASEDVGVPTKHGKGWVQIEYAEINDYKSQGYIIYFDNYGNYDEAKEPYFEEYNYYIYDETIEGTGLTRRVELAEDKADTALDTANEALINADKSLYNLYVDNTESSYVKLNLTPEQYAGGPNRILHIETEHAIVDPETGEIINNGLTTVSTVYDIYSYASSWQILDNSNLNN
jgi:hypothetical protein